MKHGRVCEKNTPACIQHVCDVWEYVFLHISSYKIDFLFLFDSLPLPKLESKCSMLVLLGFDQELDFPEDYYDQSEYQDAKVSSYIPSTCELLVTSGTRIRKR